ncbi:MAG: 3-oxoacyl-[acyl-carrier-protein] reductase [Verrucomicrobiota bacterium]
MSLKDKVAIVTGASRGIGKAIALEFAKQGCHIAGVSRSLESATLPSEEIRALGVQYEPYGVDISKEEDVDAAVSGIFKKFDEVDILINNAGITRDGLMMRMSTNDWKEVIDTNLTGAFYWTRPVAKQMARARKGRVINVGSVIGLHGNAGQANYSAAKAGLIGLTKATAKEFAARGITCNIVCPGFIETDMTEVLSDDLKSKLLEQIPLKRLGKAEDIASLVAFLATDAASYITGEVFTVDGGLFI